MKPPNLRSIDLNLLPILDALLDEKSVTLASARINLSQSATSTALGRLRETFNDPIVMRQGQRMVPSPKALLIREELKTVLRGVTEIVQSFRNPDDEEDEITLALSAPEHVHLTLSKCIRGLYKDPARPLNLTINSFERKELVQQLETGELDIAVGAFGRLSKDLYRTPLYWEKMAMIMRKDHPLADKESDIPISIAEFQEYPHLVVSRRHDAKNSYQSRWLASKSIKRKIGATVSSISLVAEILKNTDLICFGNMRGFVGTPQSKTHLTTRRIPRELGEEEYPIEMVWHERTNHDPSLEAIRAQLEKFAKKI